MENPLALTGRIKWPGPYCIKTLHFATPQLFNFTLQIWLHQKLFIAELNAFILEDGTLHISVAPICGVHNEKCLYAEWVFLSYVTWTLLHQDSSHSAILQLFNFTLCKFCCTKNFSLQSAELNSFIFEGTNLQSAEWRVFMCRVKSPSTLQYFYPRLPLCKSRNILCSLHKIRQEKINFSSYAEYIYFM